MSIHAVLPDAVGKAMASGQGFSESTMTRLTRLRCHENGFLSSPQSAWKNSPYRSAVSSLILGPCLNRATQSITPEASRTDDDRSCHFAIKNSDCVSMMPASTVRLACKIRKLARMRNALDQGYRVQEHFV